MLFAILFIVLVSFQTEVFGSGGKRDRAEERSDSEEDMGLFLAHRKRDRAEERSDSDYGDDKFHPFLDCPSKESDNEATLPMITEVNIPWNVGKHIEKLAKEYVEHCEQTIKVKINRNHGLGPALGLSKSHRHKNKTITRKLAWIAEKRNEAEIHYNTLTAEHSEYQTQLTCYDEIQELSESNTYISDERADEILQKELAFMEWRSRILRQDIPAIRAYAASLEAVIAPQSKLFKMLTNFHSKHLFTSKEGAITFVLKNVEAPHAGFFAAHRTAVEKYITDTYYPDV